MPSTHWIASNIVTFGLDPHYVTTPGGEPNPEIEALLPGMFMTEAEAAAAANQGNLNWQAAKNTMRNRKQQAGHQPGDWNDIVAISNKIQIVHVP